MEYIIIVLWLFVILFLIIRRKTIEKNWIKVRQKSLEAQARKRIQKILDEEQEVQRRICESGKEIQQINAAIDGKKLVFDAIDQSVQALAAQRDTIRKNLETYEEEERKKTDKYIEDVKQEKLKLLESQITQESQIITQQAKEEYDKEIQQLNIARDAAKEEVTKILTELEIFRAKQEAINQEILRRRELEEKTDFYRVCLSNEAIMDITELQIVRQKLKKPEILDKIIYDTYVAKPVLEMVKRVLQNSTCSGIYKITCQETKEIYIGKSTDIKNRWQQHCKTAFNCGTIASSLLHRKMQQYGIENFTFELLETVPKDKLSEREKYYIDFYKTKETGLNERSG